MLTVKRLQFYLSEEQCDQINKARAALDRWDQEHDRIRVIEPALAPNSAMDETYWLPEED
jgi:hypothetical protein